MSVMILLGAGASFGSGDCAPSPPPLGKDLFRRLRELGGFWATLDAELTGLFERDFEGGMEALYSRTNGDTTTLARLLREMAEYFLQFRLGANNAYRELVAASARSRRRVVFATLNYEMLLDDAIVDARIRIDYRLDDVFNEIGWGSAFRRVWEPRSGLTVLKPHGACNFLPDLSATGAIMMRTYSEGVGAMELPVLAANRESTRHFLDRQQVVPPALALFMRGKETTFAPGAARHLRRYYADEVANAEHIFVIGVAVRADDDHIWRPLAAAKAKLSYVGPPPYDAFDAWKDQTLRRNAFAVAETFHDSLPLIEIALRAR
jgi:hypothetical protein